MHKVIVNSTPLIALCHVNQLGLLKDLYEEIMIPNIGCIDKGNTERTNSKDKTNFDRYASKEYLYKRIISKDVFGASR